MLAAALGHADPCPGTRLLDLCTGTGLLAVTGALMGATATAVDVSRRAVLTASINARRNGVQVRTLRGSLFDPVRHERFDCITCNPPYVPSPSDSLPVRGRSRAWEGGPDGRMLLDRICVEAPKHLRPGGSLLLVHTALIDEQRTLELLDCAGLDAAIVDRRREPLGPIMSRRAEQGLLGGPRDHDELVAICARTRMAVAAPRVRRQVVSA